MLMEVHSVAPFCKQNRKKKFIVLQMQSFLHDLITVV